MATVSLVLACSHSGFLYAAPEQWNATRARRSIRADVPLDSEDENAAKFARCMQGFAALKAKLDAAQPDALLIFGDDQSELFLFDNLPAFGIYTGSDFQAPERRSQPEPLGRTGVGGVHIDARVQGCPPLATEILEGLMDRGFDLAFSAEMPERARGMGHAFMRPGYYLTPGYPLPVVPFFINCYYAPQPRATRCLEVGRAVREVIEGSSFDMNVVVIGSGGLWHTPGSDNSYLDEDFDHTILDAMTAGDGRAAAKFFDEQARPGQVGTGGDARGLDGGTHMRGGVGGGAGEWRNWMAAAGVADGQRAHVLDYVPIYASPLGAGFAYWE
jgi:hypothetical protein